MLKINTLILSLVLFSVSTMANAKITLKDLPYKDGETRLEGFLAYDGPIGTKKPAVLIVHDWMGLGTFAKAKADALARMGYVAFAVDIYGQGVRPKDQKEAGKLATEYKSNRELLRSRINAALAVLQKQGNVDPDKIAAIGFCFGGTTVLELARSGAPIKGVVSFHGGLETPLPAEAKKVQAKVLVLHGADDPLVPDAEVAGFESEMRKAGVDWQLVKYSGAVHSFTNPDAGSDNSKGAAYNQSADLRSFIAMKNFFTEIF